MISVPRQPSVTALVAARLALKTKLPFLIDQHDYVINSEPYSGVLGFWGFGVLGFRV